MAKKKVITFGNTLPYVALYPADFEDLIRMNANMVIQTTWGENIQGSVKYIYGEDPDIPVGYSLVLSRGSDTVSEDLSLTDAVNVFTAKEFSIRKLVAPFDLRNKIPFAFNMNRDRRMKSLEALSTLYQEQMIFHDEAILNEECNNDRAYIPVRFIFGNFNIVCVSDGFGQYNLSEGYYYMDGFPKSDDAIKILDMMTSVAGDKRRIDWIKRTIKERADANKAMWERKKAEQEKK